MMRHAPVRSLSVHPTLCPHPHVLLLYSIIWWIRISHRPQPVLLAGRGRVVGGQTVKDCNGKDAEHRDISESSF
jgi:hypothetical protein